jgi:hypothetical protein
VSLCSECAVKSGGVWVGDSRETFKWGACVACKRYLGVSPVSGWTWPKESKSDRGIVADIAGIGAALCLIGVVAVACIYGL